jgi:hypothetical protein
VREVLPPGTYGMSYTIVKQNFRACRYVVHLHSKKYRDSRTFSACTDSVSGQYKPKSTGKLNIPDVENACRSRSATAIRGCVWGGGGVVRFAIGYSLVVLRNLHGSSKTRCSKGRAS